MPLLRRSARLSSQRSKPAMQTRPRESRSRAVSISLMEYAYPMLLNEIVTIARYGISGGLTVTLPMFASLTLLSGAPPAG